MAQGWEVDEYALLRVLTNLTFRACEGNCRPPACIFRARAMYLAADRLGLDLQPVKVRMIAGNPAFAGWVREHRRIPQVGADEESLAAVGGEAVGNGWGVDGKHQWGGHLVLRRGEILCDPSAPDCNRPQHGIRVPPLTIGEVGGEFYEGAALTLFLRSGMCVHYGFHPAATDGWMNCPDWRRRGSYDPFVRVIVAGMRWFEKRAGEALAGGEGGGGEPGGEGGG